VARNEAHSVADVSSIVVLRTGEVVSTTDPTLPLAYRKARSAAGPAGLMT
jgi:hypothetical protein